MRIVLDLQSLQTESRNRGIGRYSLNLAQAMVRQAGNHEFVIALNGALRETIEPIREQFRDLIPPENIRVWSQLSPTNALNEDNGWRSRASELVREQALTELRPDIVHVASLFEGLGDDAVTSIGRLAPELRSAVTLYDLIPLLHAEHYLADPVRRRWYLRKLDSLRASDLLLAISDHSRREAIESLGLCPASIVTIHGDADIRFRRLSLGDHSRGTLLARHGLHRPFLMYTCTFEFRKNVDRLIEAFAQLPQNIRSTHQLVLVGQFDPSFQYNVISARRRHNMRHDEVVLVGYVDDEDLVRLYNLCELFVFPSLHEGFGLPALEAMRCGAPVIGSDRTSIPEVIGRKDALFDPTSIGAIAGKIMETLTDDGFRASLRNHATVQAGSFSWDKSAQRAIEALEMLHERQRKPRLAYVSPLPPEHSGIATYSAELLPELARHYDIELITDVAHLDEPWLDANFVRRCTAWFETQANRYDHVLYHFGNSSFHSHMFGLLRQFPGTVVLHDFFLSGVIQWMDATGHAPGHFRRSLYFSHGWEALALASKGSDDVIWTYPCNREVIELAHGIIVHSQHSLELAHQWYGSEAGETWQILPALRGVMTNTDRIQARRELGIPEDAFVVCSFGIIEPRKMNDRLIASWLRSSLYNCLNCRLIFVGEGSNAYEEALRRKVESSGCGERVAITGYVSPDVYDRWLAAADVGVQLRAGSLGETSRAVLDCLASGLATIINAHGAMAELPEEAVVILPDAFTEEELATALERLWEDRPLREALGHRAQAHICEEHAPRVVAKRYADAIEHFATRQPHTMGDRLIEGVAAINAGAPESPQELARLAEVIAENTKTKGPRQLLVDVTAIAAFDLRTGIQRVVRAVLAELLDDPPPGYRVEPVYRAEDGVRYHYARRFTGLFLGLDGLDMDDAPIHVSAGDLFLGLDLDPGIVGCVPFLRRHRDRGLKLHFLVFDILPILGPKWFPPVGSMMHTKWIEGLAEVAHGFVCISRAVADDVASYVKSAIRPRRIDVGYFHLGADIERSRPSRGIDEDVAARLAPLEGRPFFLMVGTVEPRKGYAQALDAMERLWAAGEDVALAIVGRQGWMVEALARRLRRHPQAGRRLLWLEGASDEVLEQLYDRATALLMASEGEGFGLPLIEAARHGLPIIARDLPVFREVAGEHAFYFSSTDGGALADALQAWLALHRRGEAPSVAGMPVLTWAESTRQLLDVVLGGNWYRTAALVGQPDSSGTTIGPAAPDALGDGASRPAR